MKNIYIKQMNRLGLSLKQYAQLLEIPYDVVNNYIYGKSKYDVSVNTLLEQSMMDKHQIIEGNMEEYKMKALEIKNNDIDFMEWYNNNYKIEDLKKLTKVKSIKEFSRKYTIIVKGKKASNWYYNCIAGKVTYQGHEVKKEVLLEFAEQLYDIVENKNIKKYKIRNSKKYEIKEKVDVSEKISSNTYKKDSTDDVLRKLLISRLTDEEKELIHLFGGTIQ